MFVSVVYEQLSSEPKSSYSKRYHTLHHQKYFLFINRFTAIPVTALFF